MPNTNTNILVGRNDTILGVCEAIGQDFGFHPNWLRVALAVMVYFAPVAVIGSYFALGLVVAASRWFAPDEILPESLANGQSDSDELALAA
jgi:phage shock protein PspC (stress-responsive transcriptional regulator)